MLLKIRVRHGCTRKIKAGYHVFADNLPCICVSDSNIPILKCRYTVVLRSSMRLKSAMS